ncbi:MAG: pyridoxamine 5'-phosphate oxidase [Gammaproteobacteria bacterium]|nr:pyridoxamine 5'-phosphate oxidase [Gammaproteobacteria bacterium]MDH3768030.1 pyridoxamine 5'-phosphate oxidase [Gammaproteobacteria bacterium]
MNPLQASLPAEPLQTLATWLDDAWECRHTPNANSMVLTTVAIQKGEILPSSRVLLCKHLDTENGYLVFYTNYHSRKGDELEHNRNAAVVFHWDNLGRQARVEGIVIASPTEESDNYFASRPRSSQISAWASAQSEPVASREALHRQLEQAERRFADTETIPRPPHWGGYRLWATAVELWVQGDNRLHDRARWIRTVAIDDNGQPHPHTWSATRLQP